MIFFWPKVYGPLGKTPYIYPRYQVWGVMDLGFDFWRSPLDYHPPYLGGVAEGNEKTKLLFWKSDFFSEHVESF